MDHTRRAVIVFIPTPDPDAPLAYIARPEHLPTPIAVVHQTSAVSSAPTQRLIGDR
jgi:hypothetical protein